MPSRMISSASRGSGDPDDAAHEPKGYGRQKRCRRGPQRPRWSPGAQDPQSALCAAATASHRRSSADCGRLRVGRLHHHPDHRLGPARPHEHPAFLSELDDDGRELVADTISCSTVPDGVGRGHAHEELRDVDHRLGRKLARVTGRCGSRGRRAGCP